jgi:surface polysaccharide O-acyltransferase-like enzyme
MSDERTPDPYRPPLSPEPGIEPEPLKTEGSLAAGIGLAWVVMVLGEIMFGGLGVSAHPLFLGGWFIPPLVVVVWAISLIKRGVRRTGKGMLLGLASVVAVVLLLIAACFGLLMMGGGLHNL